MDEGPARGQQKVPGLFDQLRTEVVFGRTSPRKDRDPDRDQGSSRRHAASHGVLAGTISASICVRFGFFVGRSVVRDFVMREIALSIAVMLGLALGAGCGSSASSPVLKTGPEMSTQTGSGGQGGQIAVTDAGGADKPADAGDAFGGSGGTGDAALGGADSGGLPGGEVASCSVVETQYLDTVVGAQACDPNGAGQCQQQVNAALSSCPTCMTYVNDVATVNAIKSVWDRLGCNQAGTGTCPPLSCAQPSSGACVASSAGGTCASSMTN